MEIRIAGAQIPVKSDIESNKEAIKRGINFAVEEHADILLTPEGSISGYTHQFDIEETKNVLAKIVDYAKKKHLALALGTCFVEEDEKCYNQIRFYDKEGEFLGFHSKTLVCGNMEEPPEGEINHYAVKPLEIFHINEMPIGGLICNDMWANPECTPMPDIHLSQKLSDMGARIIFHAVNGGRGKGEESDVAWQYHESNLLLRAKAGKIWIVTVDNCFPPSARCSSPSGVISPEGKWACRAETRGERFFAYTIKI